MAGAEPVMPDGVTDRAAEVWEPLVAIADVAGGHWPATARAAASHLVGQAVATGISVGTRLLPSAAPSRPGPRGRALPAWLGDAARAHCPAGSRLSTAHRLTRYG
jgi:hypothetical protein